MDEKAALAVISEQEDRIRKLTEDRANFLIMIMNYQSFVESIPDTIPGKKEKVTRLEWLTWVKETLGYESD